MHPHEAGAAGKDSASYPIKAFTADDHGAYQAATCFPGFSAACCADQKRAEANAAYQNAESELESASGQAVAISMDLCKRDAEKCSITLPNGTVVKDAQCCSIDGRSTWASGQPAKAVAAIEAAGAAVAGGGSIWWVSIDQVDETAPTIVPRSSSSSSSGVSEINITAQFPNWYPSSCSNASAISLFSTMMCQGGGGVSSVIACRATALKAKH